jgi:hypothetical protein
MPGFSIDACHRQAPHTACAPRVVYVWAAAAWPVSPPRCSVRPSSMLFIQPLRAASCDRGSEGLHSFTVRPAPTGAGDFQSSAACAAAQVLTPRTPSHSAHSAQSAHSAHSPQTRPDRSHVLARILPHLRHGGPRNDAVKCCLLSPYRTGQSAAPRTRPKRDAAQRPPSWPRTRFRVAHTQRHGHSALSTLSTLNALSAHSSVAEGHSVRCACHYVTPPVTGNGTFSPLPCLASTRRSSATAKQTNRTNLPTGLSCHSVFLVTIVYRLRTALQMSIPLCRAMA